MLNKIGVFGCVLISSMSMAGNLPHPSNFPIGKPTFECVYQAAIDHNVPFPMLLGINSIEHGKTGQEMRNRNGSTDGGAFQINSIHNETIRANNATRKDVTMRGCYNAQFAAMLLSKALNEPLKRDLDFWTRGAGYHSWTPEHNVVYRRKLKKYTLQWENWLNNLATNRPNNNYIKPISYNPYHSW